MKHRPDLSEFFKDAFLEAAAEQTFAKKRAPSVLDTTDDDPVEPVMPMPVVQKLFRIRWDTANALRKGAAQVSARKGKKVSETEIVEELLRRHFKLDR